MQDRLGLRPWGLRVAADLAGWLLAHALETDRLVDLAALVLEECRAAGKCSCSTLSAFVLEFIAEFCSN